MYVGGKQARPDGGYSQAVYSKRGKLLGHAGIGNRKDIRNAVEAARGAAGWAKATGHLRAQILYYIAENLSARADEFAARIRDLTGTTAAGRGGGRDRVDRLFTYAAWADKFDGVAKSVPIRGVALAMREPVGVIGASAPDDAPLARRGLPDRSGHRDGQPRRAGAVLPPRRWPRPTSTRCSTPRTCRAAWSTS
jgi:aldehyde dehydrogenase (NAD+)